MREMALRMSAGVESFSVFRLGIVTPPHHQ